MFGGLFWQRAAVSGVSRAEGDRGGRISYWRFLSRRGTVGSCWICLGKLAWITGSFIMEQYIVVEQHEHDAVYHAHNECLVNQG